MKNKSNFITVFVLIIAVAYILVKTYSIYAPFEAVNFPLGPKWSQTFNGEIIGLSLAEDGEL